MATDPAAGDATARAEVEVVFLEIDALHDLPGRRLVDASGEPTVAIDNDLRDLLFVDHCRMPQFVDARGREVDGSADEVAGMYAAVSLEGAEPFWRTFARKRTRPIDKKYVYVFGADSPKGDRLRLEHELYFDRGRLQRVDLAATAGSDVRRAGPRKEHGVRLDVARSAGGRSVRPSYFALLAPVQIPWQRLQDVAADGSVAARASRVGDAFWTDGFTGGDPTRARTFHELFRGGVRPDRLGLVVYLVDPFAEALRRLEPMVESLDRGIELQRARASDAAYVLAKRLDLFANAYGLESAVNPALPSYLLEADRDPFERRLAAEEACEDLLRWIGRPQRRDRIGEVDVCYRDRNGGDHPPKRGQPFPVGWCNPFSEAVRDSLGASGDARDVARNVTHAVHARLGETTAGIAWMNERFDELVAGRSTVASAGADLLFEAPRKGSGTGGDRWAPLFRTWAPVWARRYGRDAAKKLHDWLLATHDVDVATMGAAHPRREWRALSKGRKDPELAFVDPAATRLTRLGDAAALHVMAGLQLFNLAYATRALHEEDDAWHGMGLMGAVREAHAEHAKLHEKLAASRRAFRYAGATRTPGIAPALVAAASAMEHVLATRDRLNGKNDAARIGHATRTLGTALTILSAPPTARAGDAGPLLAQWMLEAAGSYAVADPAPAAVLLKHSAWGNGGDGFDRSFERSREGTFFRHAGELSELAKDLDAQATILDELLHDFRPELEIEREYESRKLLVRMGTGPDDRKRPLEPAATWSIELSIDPGDGRPREQWTFRAGGAFTHSDAGMNEPILVKTFTRPPDLDP
ncbi:MAG: hypothetical protein ABSE49_23935, partial [Polyangiaceae bacterium]